MVMWSIIPQHPKYTASNTGEICRISTGHVLKKFKMRNGYNYVCIDRKNILVARLVCAAFMEDFDIEDSYIVVHHIHDKSDDSLDNLEIMERSELLDLVEPYFADGLPRGRASLKYGTKYDKKAVPIQCIETGHIFPSAKHAAKWLEQIGCGYLCAGYVYRIAKDSKEGVRGYHFRRLDKRE